MRRIRMQCIAIVGLLAASCAAYAQEDLDACGELVQDVECVLFRAPDGRQFLLDDPGAFDVGDEVHVTGTISFACFTACQNVSGCVDVDRITSCDGELTACGTLVQGAECVLLEDDRDLRFVIENQGAFRVGDRVRVRGDFTAECFSICQQGDGCITNNTITSADVGSCEPGGGSPVCTGVSLAMMSLAGVGLHARRASSA